MFCGSRQMSHVFPLSISIYSLTPFVILADKVPRMHISAYLYVPPRFSIFFFFLVIVDDVSQAFSVRNELDGTNRLARYENWMTISGYVLLSAEDNDCVCT